MHPEQLALKMSIFSMLYRSPEDAWGRSILNTKIFWRKQQYGTSFLSFGISKEFWNHLFSNHHLPVISALLMLISVSSMHPSSKPRRGEHSYLSADKASWKTAVTGQWLLSADSIIHNYSAIKTSSSFSKDVPKITHITLAVICSHDSKKMTT